MSKTSAPPPPIATLAGRLKWVLDNRPFPAARDLAEAAGVHPSHLRLLLGGERGAKLGLRAETARAMAEAAGVPLAWLTGRPGLGLAPAPAEAAPGMGPRAQAIALLEGHVRPAALAALAAEPGRDDWSLEAWLKRGRELDAAAAQVEGWQGGGRRGLRQAGPEGVEFEGLAERLRAAYGQSGFWSQAAYAEAAGVSPNYLARLLSGDRGRRLPARTAAALASAAGVRVRWLSTGKGAVR